MIVDELIAQSQRNKKLKGIKNKEIVNHTEMKDSTYIEDDVNKEENLENSLKNNQTSEEKDSLSKAMSKNEIDTPDKVRIKTIVDKVRLAFVKLYDSIQFYERNSFHFI